MTSEPTVTAAHSDPLDAVRAALEGVAERPVDDRVAVFERTNEVLARELSVLDEV